MPTKSLIVTYAFIPKDQKEKLRGRKKLEEVNLAEFTSYALVCLARGNEKNNETYLKWSSDERYIGIEIY